MNACRPAVPVLAMLLATGCATAPRVQVDRSPDADFSRYRTYAWLELPQTQSPLVRQRIVAAVDRSLSDKGWRAVRDDEADILIAAHVTSREEETLETIYESPQWHGWRWNDLPTVGEARTLSRVDRYTIGTLIIDLFDARSQRAVWRATAEGTVPPTPDRINATIDATVPRMFAGFPPR
jgi:hypothetical protein